MAKKTKQQIIDEQKETIEKYMEVIERQEKRINELVDAEEGTFLHSPTYLQMQERIDFLSKCVELDELIKRTKE